jgi:S-(hydroxymethyl)glutathione dehydrogenase/alcohol dehydrogenase
MKAAVLHDIESPLRIEDLELLPPRAGEVLVRVEAVGVCGSDQHYMKGELKAKLPLVVGHEGSGTVEAVGENVVRVQPGDRVSLLWRPRCGSCYFCLVGKPVLCELGRVQAQTNGLPDDGTTRLRLGGKPVYHLMGVSCLAEQVVVSEKSVVKIPSEVPPRIAAISGCAVITGVGVMMNVVGVAAGLSLLVVGAGGVGLSTVLGAQLVGAYPVIVADISSSRLERARNLGATHVLDARMENITEAVQEIVSGGVDLSVDAVGSPETLREAVACLRPAGTAVAVGLTQIGSPVELPVNELVQFQKRVIGSLYGSANPFVDLPRLLELYLADRLPLDELLGDEYPLEKVNDAYAALSEGAVGRSTVIP